MYYINLRTLLYFFTLVPTICCQPLSFEILRSSLTPTSRCELISQGQCRPVLRYCINFGASIGQCRGPFSSRSCRHLFCLDWTSATRPGRHPSTSSSAAPVGNECSCSADFSVVEIRLRHSGSSSTPLAEGWRTDWLRTRRTRIQMPAWVGTAVPYPWTLPTSWSLEARQRLRSASSSSLIVRRTRLSTVGDRAFPVAAASVRHNLPQHITSAPSFHVFASRVKTHFFSVSFPEQFWMYSACEVTLSLLDTLIDHLTYLLTRMDRRLAPKTEITA